MTESILCLSIVVSVALVMGALIIVQKNHHEFIASQNKANDVDKLSEKLLLRLQEFDEYKKKIDSLTIKAGFKL